MMKSDDLNELATALAKAQSEMKAPPKDKVGGGGKYTYKYSDLATIIDTTKLVLSKNGLSVSQQMDFNETRFFLSTLLMHASGQWILSRMPLPEHKAPQELGGYLTYFRRYALCAVLGIAADDDDDAQGVTFLKDSSSQTEQESSSSNKHADYQIPFGKKYYKKTLKEIPPKDLFSYSEWLQREAEKDGKPLSGVVSEFINRTKVYLATLDQNLEPGSEG